jgi:hypothetical protein
MNTTSLGASAFGALSRSAEPLRKPSSVFYQILVIGRERTGTRGH